MENELTLAKNKISSLSALNLRLKDEIDSLKQVFGDSFLKESIQNANKHKPDEATTKGKRIKTICGVQDTWK